MATDPPALDLLTVRGRVEAAPGFLERQGLPETSKDLRALLAAYDAQAERLAAMEQAARAVCTAQSGAVWVAIVDLAAALDAPTTDD